MNKMNLREFAEVLVAMMNQQGTVCFLNNDNPAKQLGYNSIEEMCRWGEAEERRNAGYDRTKIVMQIIKSNVRRKV